MESSAVAVCAVRGNFIYLYYRSGQRPFTKPLFVLSPQSFSSSGSNTGSHAATSVPINPYAPSSLSQTNSYSRDDTTTIITPSKNDDGRTLDTATDIGPTTAPSSGGNGALFIQVQNTYNSSPSLETLGLQASSISIAATSSFDSHTGIYRYDLLLAFSQLPPSSPLVFQMTAQSPATGNSQDSSISDSPWTLNTISQPAITPFGVATQFWLAASASSAPEGSSFYQLYSTHDSPELRLSRYDAAKQNVTDVSGTILIRADLNPTMIKLTGITRFNGAIIGDSSTTATSTGIQFMDSTGPLPFVMTIQDTYDSTACYTSANGQIIKATQGTIETTTVDGSISVWSLRQSSNPLPSPVLTCAALGNTLYAVVKGGSDGMPMVYTAEMNDWIWRSRQLYNLDSTGGGSGSVGVISTDHNRRSGLSAGSMVGIAVAVVVLGGVGFWWLMRRRRTAKDLKGLDGRVEKITVRPPPPGAGGVMMPGQQRYPPAYTAGQAPPPPGSVSISPQQNYHQQVPSSAAGWTTAVYSPSTRPGEHIPMVASSLTTAPPAPLTHINNNMVYSSASSSIPSTPVYSPSTPIVGDKQELTSEDTTILPASVAVGHHHQRPSTAMSHNSHQEGSSNTLMSATSQPAGTVRGDNRRQEMFSPALANAQLILQRSQSPPNQTYQELQQPYHR